MLQKKTPTQFDSWQKLEAVASGIRQRGPGNFGFKDLPFDEYSVGSSGLVFDYSRNLINGEIIDQLERLASESKVKQAYEYALKGEKINETENRAVLHYALRKPENFDYSLDGIHVRSAIKESNARVKDFADRFVSGQIKGANGKTLNTIVNIGIGGSDLGPSMVTEALRPYRKNGIRAHFVSNVDPRHLEETLESIDPASVLFIISSKTFTTQETMANASEAKKWLAEKLGSQTDLSSHFLAVSTNRSKAKEFGIGEERIFGFWDWVGGRYSLWSAIGISIACTIGWDNYSRLLQGAANCDEHFANQPFRQNIPMLMALLGIWYGNFLHSQAQAIIPYSQDLHRFPAYLQQADMESNGKSVDREGRGIDYGTGPIVWGEPGTNGQHAFFQLLHQGTHLIPVDFILFGKYAGQNSGQHQMLLANGLAQREALWRGKSRDEVLQQLENLGVDHVSAQKLAPYKVFAGQNPSNTFLFDSLSPENLGFLIACYEHKIFAQGVIWNIFSFDQWGVELGKEIANTLLPVLGGESNGEKLLDSTRALIKKIKDWK